MAMARKMSHVVVEVSKGFEGYDEMNSKARSKATNQMNDKSNGAAFFL